MLSDDDKNRIRQEEFYRQEVRQALEREKSQPKSGWGKFVAFLNTGIGLWLLSSVALGFITWSYTKWDTNRIKARENRHTAEKVNLEISERLHRLTMEVDEEYQQYVQAKRRSDLPLAAAGIVAVTVSTINESPEQEGTIANVYPEFRSVSLVTLLHNLRDLNPESEDDAKKAINALRNLSDDARRYWVAWYPGDDKWEQSEHAQVSEFTERTKKTVSADLKVWSF
jgi:hypothetical protein